MTEDITALIAKLRAEGKTWREEIGDMPLFDKSADALQALLNERDAQTKRITDAQVEAATDAIFAEWMSACASAVSTMPATCNGRQPTD